jgi:hypothetical protein
MADALRMTADVKGYVGFRINELGSAYYESLTEGGYGVENAIWEGFLEYAKRTLAFRAEYEGVCVADTGVYAYTDVNVEAGRLWGLWSVWVDDRQLDAADERTLLAMNTKWRSAGSGTPTLWMPWGHQAFRIWKPPSSGLEILIDGFETPSRTAYDADGDAYEFPIHESHVKAVGLWACVLLSIKDPSDSNALRLSPFYKEWESAIDEAERDNRRTMGTVAQFGKYADTGGVTSPFRLSRTVEIL